jgi:hypothetical protein
METVAPEDDPPPTAPHPADSSTAAPAAPMTTRRISTDILISPEFAIRRESSVLGLRPL